MAIQQRQVDAVSVFGLMITSLLARIRLQFKQMSETVDQNWYMLESVNQKCNFIERRLMGLEVGLCEWRGELLARLTASETVLGAPGPTWGLFGVLQGRLGGFRGHFGGLLGRLAALLGAFWVPFGQS
ncbi:unnamed protein product [Prorocentrum cordatum]|uniref:Uncharacterized protein n=1 Tax=Prorocentrum cordatum TaxID=2364126 RepID=A0ABN9R067_9DINO|nr:unnamed protein product [Polarella glacialis]